MRSVELAKVAVAAEALRLRQLAGRQSRRAVFGAGAAVFGLAALAVLHVLLWIVLRFWLSPVVATLIVLGVDLVVAGIMAALALRSRPGTIEEEAGMVRTQAILELKQSLSVFGLASQVAGLVLRRRARVGARIGARRGAASIAMDLASRFIGR